MIDVYLLLGSNLGNRLQYLKLALACIVAEAGHLVEQSSVYETQSWGKANAPDYLNQVVLIQTQLAARPLLKTLLDIEQELGRIREEKWGSRTIDIDILFYGNEIINEPELTVPHPQLHKRRFTLEPLAEIAPQLVHPVMQKTVDILKSELDDTLQIKKILFLK
jgi:2-amino-4-hydroxy-6-hydroxymethyldihydropteridine diphosphokinase